ncbi:response regulator [Colwellia psychrerythraea]|uniref:histidine kinase n=1 Tax=Colwellia psychrerythraea TaxID=28229 RepID=A0A099KUS6_COLPS|nr:response regulator [Colwellia psychrerythraea]KGJ93950.1 integral membrane sensor hybrid histidine kinase [Colwellia psychrerythraea]
MANNSKNSGSLGRRLLVRILMMAILPLLMLSIISYKYVSEQLQESTVEHLASVTNLESKSIAVYFDRLLQDLMLESDRVTTVALLQSLKKAYQASDKPLKEFVRSYRWTIIANDQGTDLALFGATYDYADILLVDNDGNILFTLNKHSDLGSKLFSADKIQSRLALSTSKTLTSGEATFSDLEYYAPTKQIAGFFINTLLDEEGDKIGALIFKVSHRLLTKIISEQNLNEEAMPKEIFLIGLDKLVRAKANDGQDNESILTEKFAAKEIDLWFEHHLKTSQSNNLTHKPIFYSHPVKGDVIAQLHPVTIADKVWLVVAEVKTQDVYVVINTLVKVFSMFTVATIVLIIVAALPMTQKIIKPLIKLTEGVRQASLGNLDIIVDINDNTEIGILADGYNAMLANLKHNKQQEQAREWFDSGIVKLNDLMRGAVDKSELSNNILQLLINHCQGQIGTLYWQEKTDFRLMASYGIVEQETIAKNIKAGSGLVGQVALDLQSMEVNDVPDNYHDISSSLGNKAPGSILIYPIIYNQKAVAIVEIAWLDAIPQRAKTFLSQINEIIAIGFIALNQSHHVMMMLKDSQLQSKELQTQQEELRVTNEALSAKSDALRNQQSTLKVAHQETKEKAKALEEASKYKSEFLANMSHELRTPLNSLLILARSLTQNDEGNLSEDEVESAQVILESGRNLLELINEILDLSKVEAGQMKLIAENIYFRDLLLSMNSRFKHMAEDKQISFSIELSDELDESFVSDSGKLGQILSNLISNALKFTDQGGVTLTISIEHSEGLLAGQNQVLALRVKDTGIGIAHDKLQAVFEAFQQADGTTSRTHGGTGLGLSIALSLTRLLGGDIQLESTPGQGSTFNLYLPLKHADLTPIADNIIARPQAIHPIKEPKSDSQPRFMPSYTPPPFVDDRERLDNEKQLILVIEDDPHFAKIVYNACHKQNCQVIVAADGETGLTLAAKYPINGIILDYMLPGLNGGEALSRIRSDDKIKQLPVHLISALDNLKDVQASDSQTTKPVSKERLEQIISSLSQTQKTLEILAIENDPNALFAINKLFEKENVNIHGIDNATQAIELLQDSNFDAIVLDLNLPGMSGFEFLDKATVDNKISLPVIFIYSGRDISEDDLHKLAPYSTHIITKSARSPERLVDEIHLFANQLACQSLSMQTPTMQDGRDTPENTNVALGEHTILLVDDDMRNTFALAKVLRKENLKVRLASSGQQSIDMLAQHNDIELVLMDIMMPGMDGYEAMRKIRSQDKFQELSIIAVTANAMPGDKEKCLNAGANDYLSKPIDVGQLLTMMKLWI